MIDTIKAAWADLSSNKRHLLIGFVAGLVLAWLL